MEQKRKKFIRLRFIIAKDKLKSARLLLKAGQYRDCISRAYYAMYYGAKALLLAKDVDPKTHKGVKALLSEYFVRTKVIDKRFSKMFALIERARGDADYKELVKITRKDGQAAIDFAEKFVKKMREVAKEYLPDRK